MRSPPGLIINSFIVICQFPAFLLNALYLHQYGFRPNHATIHPIIHLLNACAQSANKQPKEYTATISCDLSKAFDIISHEILTRKLEYYGLRGLVKDWLVNYLTDRVQYVEVEHCISSTCSIDCGVPQGSILGPLLYLIYVNDIAESTNAKILSFADDTSLYVSDCNVDNLFRKANIAANNLFDWFCSNRLSLNPNKTKYIVLRTPHQRCDITNHSIIINGTPLGQISQSIDEPCTKFLGVQINEFLSWNFQLKQINKKISRALFAIKKVKHFLPVECLRTVYFSMIHPHLTYGILAWGKY